MSDSQLENATDKANKKQVTRKSNIFANIATTALHFLNSYLRILYFRLWSDSKMI